MAVAGVGNSLSRVANRCGVAVGVWVMDGVAVVVAEDEGVADGVGEAGKGVVVAPGALVVTLIGVKLARAVAVAGKATAATPSTSVSVGACCGLLAPVQAAKHQSKLQQITMMPARPRVDSMMPWIMDSLYCSIKACAGCCSAYCRSFPYATGALLDVGCVAFGASAEVYLRSRG